MGDNAHVLEGGGGVSAIGNGISGVYGLVDPRDGLIHYVGQALDIHKRYLAHIRNARVYGKIVTIRSGLTHGGDETVQFKGHKDWICDVMRTGLIPEVVVLQECAPELLDIVEYELVSEGIEAGWPLVNQNLTGRKRKYPNGVVAA